MEWWMLWLWVFVSNLSSALSFITAAIVVVIVLATTIGGAVVSIVHFIEDDDDLDSFKPKLNKHIKPWYKKIIIIFIACMMLGSALPTKSELAMIYVIPKIANSEAIKKDIPEIYDLGVNKLKEYLKADPSVEEPKKTNSE